MNTQNIKELEKSQNSVISKWNVSLLTGIKNGYVNTEDNMPSTTVMGKFDKASGLEFTQELANQMNIRILLNKIETWYKNDESVLNLIYDIDSKQQNDLPVKSDPHYNPEFGMEITPQVAKKLKI